MINLLADSSFNPIYLIVAILLGLFVGLLIAKNGKIDKTKIQGLNVKDFLDTKRKGTLVDCRKEELFKENKIVGAKNFPGKSGAKTSQVRKDIPIFIYDQNGKKAYSIAKKYVKYDAVMVYYMIGGFEEYTKSKEGNNVK